MTSLMSRLSARIESSWYQNKWRNFWLLPLSGLFFLLSHGRRLWLTKVRPAKKNNKIPVVIIGNINVGGTGKTPLSCRLVECLQGQGISVGIISRGYGSQIKNYPYLLQPGDAAKLVGDEPKLLRDRLGCPVVIGPDRNAAINLLSQQNVDIILSDDGLQHYQMARDYEIVVLDASRQLGSGWLLPAGPLREGAWRLGMVDATIYNGSMADACGMEIVPSSWVNAKTGERKELSFFAGRSVQAVAGIGNPQRFFSTLDDLNVKHQDHIFADHYDFNSDDLQLLDHFSDQLVMTEKDWVKCSPFAEDNMWYLEIDASLNAKLEDKLINDLSCLVKQT